MLALMLVMTSSHVMAQERQNKEKHATDYEILPVICRK
jgi:hypothetical protein